MKSNRWHIGSLTVIALTFMLGPWLASGQSGETVGTITEIKVGRGRVEVKPAGGQEWRRAGPLLALRAGDTLRASDDASVVILLSGGRGAAKVSAASSPYVVSGPQGGASKAQKAVALLEASVGFLSSTAKEEPKAALSTRGGPKPPVILAPRNGPVLPDSLTFEWLGSRFSRYTVRVLGPSGVVLERKGVTGARFDYPSDAPRLAPGVRYTFEVIAGNHPAQKAWFELLDPARAQTIRRDLTELESEVGPAVSPNTLVTLRAGLLASNGLLHDARLSLIAALSKDPDEPTFHLLLGNLYGKVDLPEQAAEAFDEARFLMTGPTKR